MPKKRKGLHRNRPAKRPLPTPPPPPFHLPNLPGDLLPYILAFVIAHSIPSRPIDLDLITSSSPPPRSTHNASSARPYLHRFWPLVQPAVTRASTALRRAGLRAFYSGNVFSADSLFAGPGREEEGTVRWYRGLDREHRRLVKGVYGMREWETHTLDVRWKEFVREAMPELRKVTRQAVFGETMRVVRRGGKFPFAMRGIRPEEHGRLRYEVVCLGSGRPPRGEEWLTVEEVERLEVDEGLKIDEWTTSQPRTAWHHEWNEDEWDTTEPRPGRRTDRWVDEEERQWHSLPKETTYASGTFW